MLSQIRALPNPLYSAADGRGTIHPLTLHLSPTSTANISVTSFEPAPPASAPFAKIAPDAEVIVAPKLSPSNVPATASDLKGVGKSRSSNIYHGTPEPRASLFFRAINRQIVDHIFDSEIESNKNEGLKVWIDEAAPESKQLKDASYVSVHLLRPPGLQTPVDPQQLDQQKESKSSEAGEAAQTIVAQLYRSGSRFPNQHAVLSSVLCRALELDWSVGEIVHIEPAPPQLLGTAIKVIKIYPFAPGTTIPEKDTGLKIGGTSAPQNDLLDNIQYFYGTFGNDLGLFGGPITNGMILPRAVHRNKEFAGGIIRFDPSSLTNSHDNEAPLPWILGSNYHNKTSIQMEMTPLPRPLKTDTGESLSISQPEMVAIDPVIASCISNIFCFSSILLTGGVGSGKTSLCHLLGHIVRRRYLYSVSYFPCTRLIADEIRISAIKETLIRIFRSAFWRTRLGGRALIILDNLDKLCPVETELQVGGENGRSHQIAELLCSITREICNINPHIVVLATVQAKEFLNNVIISGHVIKNIISLRAPDREGRRKILEQLVVKDQTRDLQPQEDAGASNLTSSWMDLTDSVQSQNASIDEGGFALNTDLDLLEVAGKTDGYMPGDLKLLTSRARNEALISLVHKASTAHPPSPITLSAKDFNSALRGFTPVSLRNVTLTTSTTSFSTIGGLRATRQTLIETLQFPTKYAPIFAQCPLRLPSGLLLYGYPGCGKTLLASAVAGECGLNFISVKGPEVLNKYIGASEKSVRDLFDRAQAARPCVLFFDEFDSIAPKRGHDSTGVTDRVVNQLLTQMDGAEGLSGVYVLAATSRPDLIDPALLRPGRLDKTLICDMPDHEDRKDIILAVSKNLHLSEEVVARVDEIASRTADCSGADLQAIVYNAHLEAIHDRLSDDRSLSVPDKSSSLKDEDGSSKSTIPENAAHDGPSFFQFLYSPIEHDKACSKDRDPREQSETQPEFARNAATYAEVEALEQYRRRERDAVRRNYDLAGLPGPDAYDTNDDITKAKGDKETPKHDPITIQWTHVERSLASTRRSVSEQERKRLDTIYHEFVVGRTGDMPTGEASSEIGGRASLM